MITQEYLKSIVEYDVKSGLFFKKDGTQFGWIRKDKYRLCRINGKDYYQHRLVFLYLFGEIPLKYVDHINGDPSDNRIENLRQATQSENIQNQKKPHVDNKSGYLGVHWSNLYKTWIAQISKNGKRKTLGRFKTAEDAHKRYLEEKSIFHDGLPNVK